jgi:HEAT repeat protein
MKEFIGFCLVLLLAAQQHAGDLASQLKSEKATWFAYTIKTENKSNNWCDGQHDNPVHLEGSDTATVLLRVEANQVQKIRIYSAECKFDSKEVPLVWLSGITNEESLHFFKNLKMDGAAFAISQHAGPEATDILIDRAKNDSSTHEREQAIFWLAQRAGKKSAAAISDAIINDPDTGVKKKAVFALSQLPKDEGVPRLIEVAKTQRNPEVRKQAFFWLGQTHDPRALAYIEDILTK